LSSTHSQLPFGLDIRFNLWPSSSSSSSEPISSSYLHGRYLTMTPQIYQFCVGMFASLRSFLSGYDLGVIAQVIASPSFTALFNVSSGDSET
jgi:hypothetical protein